jgi:Tol biopolymer transport system component
VGAKVEYRPVTRAAVGHDRNGERDLFVRDRVAGTTARVNVSTSGAASNGAHVAWALAADGRWVAFNSTATNLVGSDTNAATDVFARGPLR